MAVPEISEHIGDARRVALIKSLATNNRFYALVPPESGIHNADTVAEIPPDILLGIAYPCLEDGLNDFAVVRTCFETLVYYPDDKEMEAELRSMVNDARTKLVLRLSELRDLIGSYRAHFLGTDLDEFKAYVMDLHDKGCPRRNLDNMMKVNVFDSVAKAESNADGLYKLEFRTDSNLSELRGLPSREFLGHLFTDVLRSVQDDSNYATQYLFDRHVFQKFIALMFVNYATTGPEYYGTNKADYGVSGDKEMDSTPLYKAVAAELRRIERELGAGAPRDSHIDPQITVSSHEAVVKLPNTIAHEDILLGPIASICAAANQLAKYDDHETVKLARVVLAGASRVVAELKNLGIVSPVAYDPGNPDSSG